MKKKHQSGKNITINHCEHVTQLLNTKVEQRLWRSDTSVLPGVHNL